MVKKDPKLELAAKQRKENENRILNLGLRIQEKNLVDSPFLEQFKVVLPSEFRHANTTDSSRPRAHAIGYNYNSRTLYIVFRDGTQWQYDNVGANHWEALQITDSTGRYLASSGLDRWPTMGPADTENISPEAQARLSQTAATASRIQKVREDFKIPFTGKE
jgi:uncharacterized DUF497 family protein